MNKTTIKEIKSIYSGRIKSQKSEVTNTEIKTIKNNIKTSSGKNGFFTGVIEKLNITPKKD